MSPHSANTGCPISPFHLHPHPQKHSKQIFRLPVSDRWVSLASAETFRTLPHSDTQNDTPEHTVKLFTLVLVLSFISKIYSHRSAGNKNQSSLIKLKQLNKASVMWPDCDAEKSFGKNDAAKKFPFAFLHIRCQKSYLEVLQLPAVILQLPFFVFYLCLSLPLLLRGKKNKFDVTPDQNWAVLSKFAYVSNVWKSEWLFYSITNEVSN